MEYTLGGMTDEQVWELIKWFVQDSLQTGEINLENWDDWDAIEKSDLSKRKCGYDLFTQILYRAHMRFIQAAEEGHCNTRHNLSLRTPRSKVFASPAKPEGPRTVLAPDTIDFGGDNIVIDTCKAVPETQPLDIDDDLFLDEQKADPDEFDIEKDNFKTPQSLQAKTKRKSNKGKRNMEETEEADVMLRAKYPVLDQVKSTKDSVACVTPSFRKGLFGTGPSPDFRCKSDHTTSEEETESPSLFSIKSINRKRTNETLDSETGEDENNDFAGPKLSPKNRKKKIPKTNKWELEVSDETLSQKKKRENLKQGSLDGFLSGKVGARLRANEDEDLQRAIEMSKKESIREPLSTINDSYNDIPEPVQTSPGKAVVRGKARKLLQGFSCQDCAKWYEDADLSEAQLQKLLDKCSKHRSDHPPPADSPKFRWELDIRGDRECDRTQVGPPLMTRERRRALRNAKQ